MPYKAVVLDFGGVLFAWKKQTKPSGVPGMLIKQIMSSPTWSDYECGHISRERCYLMLSDKYSIEFEDLDACFQGSRESLIYDATLLDFARTISEEQGISIFAMTNIGHKDFAYIRNNVQGVEWGIFDRVFPSYEASARKPDPNFYKHFLSQVDIDPAGIIYVDDKVDNVITARSLGMKGIVFTSAQQVMQAVKNTIYDPVQRAVDYLVLNAGGHESFTNTGISISENFAQYLILDITGDKYVILISSMHRSCTQ